jgi:hypothetical protein
MRSSLLSSNVHPFDRGFRIVLGLGLLALVVVGPQTMWGYLGIVPLVTGLAGSCPLYSILGISTCSTAPRRTA